MVPNKKLLIVAGIVSLSLAPRFLFVGVQTVFEERPVERLPERVGDWEAVEVLVCPECLKELKEEVWQRKPRPNPKAHLMYLPNEVDGANCPVHHVPLTRTKDVPVDFLTQKVLGRGTEFLKKWYQKGGGGETPPREVMATIVTSGADKRSIHRPETCLLAQGWQIISRERWPIPPSPSGKRNPAATRLVARQVRLTPEGKMMERKQVLLYWFMGHNRLTGSNLRRMMYASWDRMFRGLNYRWAYALLISPVDGAVRDGTEELAKFVSEVLPLIHEGN